MGFYIMLCNTFQSVSYMYWNESWDGNQYMCFECTIGIGLHIRMGLYVIGMGQYVIGMGQIFIVSL